jgi:HAD superfamily hydrolase (TIGR01549 family)
MTLSGGAVIFDLDGTLTRPFLDFDLIRHEIGLPRGPILEAVARLPPPEQARAGAILERHEEEAAAASTLQEGAAEVVEAVRAAGMPVALMTRNSRRSVQRFQARHGIRFDLVRTREDGPVKPSPAPVFDICSALGVSSRQSWVVGDFHFDILCGAAAGARTVLLLDAAGPRPPWADEADFVIHRLHELLVHMGLRPGR